MNETPFWRKRNLSATIQSNSTIFTTAFDNSPKDGSLGVALVLIEGNNARELATWSFLMATVHGAGLMVLPFVLGTGASRPAAALHHHHAMSLLGGQAGPLTRVLPWE